MGGTEADARWENGATKLFARDDGDRLLLAAFANLIECRLGELERHDSKTPLAFACRRDTEWQAPLFPLKDVYLVGLDPHSLVIKAEVQRDFVGDFDCGHVSVWRHVRYSANDYLSGVIFTGL